MVDELKFLLDQIKDVPSVALWMIGGFLFYKLVAYLSTTGAIIYIVRLLCNLAIEWQTKPRPAKFKKMLFDDLAEQALVDLLLAIKSPGASWVHSVNIHELQAVWNAKTTSRTSPQAETTTQTT